MTNATLNSSNLDKELNYNYNHRIKDDNTLDINKEFEKFANNLGFSTSDAGGKVTFKGKDPIVKSTIPLATAASMCLVLKWLAAAKIGRMRGGKPQDLSIDLGKSINRLSALYRCKETLNGYNSELEDPNLGLLLSFFKTKDHKFIMPDNNTPKLRDRMEALIDCQNNFKSIAKKILQWNADDLEKAGMKRGLIFAKARSLPEFMKEKVYQDYMKNVPLVEVEKIGDSKPEPFSKNPVNPLDGLRVLAMAHVIAGSTTGRALACHGADVLNIWRPNEFDFESSYNTADVGLRSSRIDYKKKTGRDQLVNLVKNADVFMANRRQKLLQEIHWTPEDVAKIRPGIVYCNMSYSGDRGPWKDAVGYDQVAGCVTGIGELDGTKDRPQLPIINIVNDTLTGWLASIGIQEALIRRAKEGGSYRVHVSLVRTALWVMSLGIFDKDYVNKTYNQTPGHEEKPSDLFTARTPLGFYRGVTDQVKSTSMKEVYKYILEPKGANYPVWLEHGVEPYWQPAHPDANVTTFGIQEAQSHIYDIIDQMEKDLKKKGQL